MLLYKLGILYIIHSVSASALNTEQSQAYKIRVVNSKALTHILHVIRIRSRSGLLRCNLCFLSSEPTESLSLSSHSLDIVPKFNFESKVFCYVTSSLHTH